MLRTLALSVAESKTYIRLLLGRQKLETERLLIFKAATKNAGRVNDAGAVHLEGSIDVAQFDDLSLAEIDMLVSEGEPSCDLLCIDDVDSADVGLNLAETLKLLRGIARKANIPVVVTLTDQIIGSTRVTRRQVFEPWENEADTIPELQRPDALNISHQRCGELDVYAVKAEQLQTPRHLAMLLHQFHYVRISDVVDEV